MSRSQEPNALQLSVLVRLSQLAVLERKVHEEIVDLMHSAVADYDIQQKHVAKATGYSRSAITHMKERGWSRQLKGRKLATNQTNNEERA